MIEDKNRASHMGHIKILLLYLFVFIETIKNWFKMKNKLDTFYFFSIVQVTVLQNNHKLNIKR